MAAPETEVIGVDLLLLVDYPFDISAVDASNDVFTIDDPEGIAGSTLSDGDKIVVFGSTGNDAIYTIDGAPTDNSDGTFDVTTDESVTDSTADGTLAKRQKVGSQSDLSMTWNTEAREILKKQSTDWTNRLMGRAEWGVEHSGHFLNASSEEFIANGNVELRVQDPGAGSSYEAVPGISSGTLTLSQTLTDVASIEKELWRYVRPARRSFTLDTTSSWFDPNSTAGSVLGWIKTYKTNGDLIPFEFDVAGLTFSGNLAPADFELTAGADSEDAELSLSLPGDGTLSMTGSPESTIAALIEAFMEGRELVALMETQTGGAVTTGAQYFAGKGYSEETTVEFTEGEEVTISASITGNGPLADGAVAEATA